MKLFAWKNHLEGMPTKHTAFITVGRMTRNDGTRNGAHITFVSPWINKDVDYVSAVDFRRYVGDCRSVKRIAFRNVRNYGYHLFSIKVDMPLNQL